MNESAHNDSRAVGWARVVTFSFGVSVATALATLAVYATSSSVARGAEYPVGVVVGLPGLWACYAITSLPLLLRGRVVVAVSAIASALLVVARMGAAHYHSALGRLPGFRTAQLLAHPGPAMRSVQANAPWVGLLAEVVFVVACGLVSLRVLSPRLERRLSASWHPRGIASIVAFFVLTFAAAFGATRLGGQVYYGAVNPLWHLQRTHAEESAASGAHAAPSVGNGLSDVVARVQAVLAVEHPGPVADPAYPYCRAEGVAATDPLRRSAIVLILESVSSRMLGASHSGRKLVPNLERIAAENLSFEQFFASGDRSSQALVSILAGVPVVTHRRVLSHAPMVRLRGFPSLLAARGASSVYLHGSDLSFEQQRSFLRAAGFEQIIEPDLMERRGRGWGASDEVMFARLREWIVEHRQRKGDAAYLATLFTLSTHDPYVLPDGVERRFQGDDAFSHFADTALYADEVLGAFYDWYVREEKPKGTLLFVTGDHAPRAPFPGDPATTSTGELEYDFRVPLVVAGLSGDERPDSVERRIGGHLDVGPTLLPLLGETRRDCMQGRNLLAAGEFPEQRVVASMAGESLELLYLHVGRDVWQYHLRTGALKLFDRVADPLRQRDLFTPQHPGAAWGRGFTRDYMRLGEYLNLGNHFAPPRADDRKRAALQPLRPPLLVSHRGNVAGAGSAPDDENTLDGVEAAATAGFEWVEIDVGITGDKHVVLNHDRALTTASGSDSAPASPTGAPMVEEMPLAKVEAKLGRPLTRLDTVVEALGGRVHLCVELKTPKHALVRMDLVRGALEALDRLPKDAPVIVDSFDRTTVVRVRETLVQRARRGDSRPWQVAFDFPQKPVQGDWLEFASQSGFDWVYVHERFVTPDVVVGAHALGLRVMAYPVDDRGRARALLAAGVDGIMADRAGLLE